MASPGIRLIITGTTGMVGEGVLHVCLNDPRVTSVLVINRKTLGLTHPKLKEILHENFYDLSPIEQQLSGYDACFFCLGITSVGISAEAYYKITYTLTLHAGETLSRLNPAMTFCYISGGGTDRSEKGRVRWARVKGKTENDLMKLPFKKAYGVRPGFIRPIKGLTRTHSFYKYIGWLYPIGRTLYPGGFCTMEELARCMIHLAVEDGEKNIIEGKDIIRLGA